MKKKDKESLFLEKIQLICFGYAGSVASNFNQLSSYLKDTILFSVVEYRGRGSRSKEEVYKNNKELIVDAAEQIKKIRKLEMPYAILGYSMGVQVVYELFAQHLIEEMPTCVILAAHQSPDVDCTAKGVNLEDREEFLKYVKRYGGLDERLLREERFASIFLSRIKTDFKLLQLYQFNGEYYKFPVKVVILYSEEDTPYQVMQKWKQFAEQEIKFYSLEKGHFFYKTDPEKFCMIIKAELEYL